MERCAVADYAFTQASNATVAEFNRKTARRKSYLRWKFMRKKRLLYTNLLELEKSSQGGSQPSVNPNQRENERMKVLCRKLAHSAN